MAVTLASLGLDRLPPEDRLALAHELWDSLFPTASPGSLLTEEQLRELDRRVVEDDANPHDVVRWEDVKARALARPKA